MSKLPLLNQRSEYEHYKRLLRDLEFRTRIEDPSAQEFDCGKFVWAGRQEGISVLLQRIILGVEAWIPIAVLVELSCQKRLTKGMVEKISDPFSLGGRGTADCYFNRTPALVSADSALRVADPELWQLMRTFYRKIRNPIFHGSYISKITATDLDYVFEQFDRVYTWCDSWCDVYARINEIGSGKYGRPIGR